VISFARSWLRVLQMPLTYCRICSNSICQCVALSHT
jgi:hypothetical protein